MSAWGHYKHRLRRQGSLRKHGWTLEPGDEYYNSPGEPEPTLQSEWNQYVDNLPGIPHVKVYEPDHEYPGEVNEHHYELDPHDEFDSVPEQAASRLSDHGLTAPSRAPGWSKGTWYTDPDEGGDYSGHLEGLTPDQEREVWAILQSQNDLRNRAPDAPPLGQPPDWA